MNILYTIPKNFSSVFVIFSLTNCKFYTIFNYIDRFHGKCYNQTGLKGGFFMWLKNKKINWLERSIDNLSNTLEKGNYMEWAYLLR